MTLLVVGINHNTASLDLRARVSFLPEKLAAALMSAREALGQADVAILSTCNRTELYLDTDLESGAVLDWLAMWHKADRSDLALCHYTHTGQAALRHMMLVSSGLDSLVLGEPQIFGQMKSAFATADEVGTLQGMLHQLFQQVFAVAKRVRSETAIGQNPVSVAYAAVRLARRIFSDLNDNTALLIGAGKTIELVARHLREQGVGNILIANRNPERARQLAQEVRADAFGLGDIPVRLHEADIVISSTASQLPLLGKGAVEEALRKRKHKPIFMVDLAVPRDIEAQVAELEDVYLFTVDDLRDVIDENLRAREQAAEDARILIEESLVQYQDSRVALETVRDIVTLRSQAETLRDNELEKAMRQLARGESAEIVLRQFARSLTNKLLHEPTEFLRKRNLPPAE
jgi:glutamyl-tRNA reductase